MLNWSLKGLDHDLCPGIYLQGLSLAISLFDLPSLTKRVVGVDLPYPPRQVNFSWEPLSPKRPRSHILTLSWAWY